jgi:ABC-type nitrate/sulfonate/bicarbonate transport system substrate-binding protein
MMDRNDVLDGTNPELVKRIRQEEYAKAEEEIRKRTDEAAEAARKRAEEEQEEVEEDDDEAEEDEDEDLGEEVTEDFEGAEEKKLTVHKKDRKFVVRDDDGEQLHEEPMTKKQAKSFIEKHGETEE